MDFVGSRKEFVKKYGPFIHYITKGTGILPGTLIAQAILESSGKYNGVWAVGGSGLSREANNFFGIKAGSAWNGPTIDKTTGEQTPKGQKYNVVSAFRSYPSVEDSIIDYVKFLKVNPRYKNVFFQPTVLKQATELKKAGYATANNYANTVNSVYNSVKNEIEAAKNVPYSPGNDKPGLIKYIIPMFLIIGSLYYAQKKGYLDFKF